MTTDAAPQDAWDPVADLSPVEVAVPGAAAPAVVFLCRFPGCGRQFQLKGNLKRHQHIHGGDKPFRCADCGRSFLRKADMEVHQRVHTGEKPYMCQHSGCGKRFARRSDLLSHERTHSGSKPYACEFPGCGRRFARRFDLHKHERSHGHDDGCAASAGKKKLSMKRRLVAKAIIASEQQDAATTETDDKRTPLRPIVTGGSMPISPTDHANGPGKERHFELKCTEDHAHTLPDCFSIEEWDALLGTSAPSSAAAAACCPEHLQSVAETFAAAHVHAHAFDSFHQSTHVVDSFAVGGRTPPSDAADSQKQQQQQQPFAFDVPASLFQASAASPSHSATDAMTARLSSTSLYSPCPVAATAKLHDYSAHTACGHLAIQHGDHRDFVVKNHLVCVDNVKSLSGDCGGAHASVVGTTTKRTQPKPAHHHHHAAQDPHRPGCGHLAVRHGDHIDYVVEDNLFCQLAGGLMEDGAGGNTVELLDDDFWDFYGAIGSLKSE